VVVGGSGGTPRRARAEDGQVSQEQAESVRQRIAAQQAAERRAERCRQILLAGGAVVVVVAIVVVIVVLKLNSGHGRGTAPSGSTTGTLLPASVINEVARVPASTLDAVGPAPAAPDHLEDRPRPRT
jgi:hypothetical protein